MSQIFSCLFLLLIAYNSYQTAKRQGVWSWKEFVIVLVVLGTVPILIVLPLFSSPWLRDKPELATLIATVSILLFVCALAYCLHKFFPAPKKPAP
jgi:hypothetical protein